MRQRPDVVLYYTPRAVHPGRVLEVEARLTSPAETPVDGVTLRLSGGEQLATGHGYFDVKESQVAWEARFDEMVLTPGEHRLHARFALPPDMVPSFAGSYARVVYSVEVRVDIPWWPDKVQRFELPVLAEPLAAPRPERRVFTSRQPSQPDAPWVEATFDHTVIEPGGTLVGALSLGNLRGRSLRGVSMAFVAVLTSPDGLGGESTRVEHQYTARVFEGTPVEGARVEVRLRLPGEVPCSTRGKTFSLTWFLEVRADGRLSQEALLTIPITVAMMAGRARVDEAPLPAVGRDRRAEVWSALATSHGMVHDPDVDTLRGRDGDVAFSLSTRSGAEGPCVVVRLDWPSLGIDLDVRPSRWLDALTQGAGVALSVEALHKRMRARGREARQVTAFLSDAVQRALDGFTDLTITDEGATLTTPGDGTDGAEVDALVRRVRALAAAVRRAHGEVPPPAAAEGAAEAWRRYGASRSARYEAGRVYLHDARVGADRVSLGMVWEGAQRATTTARVALDPPAQGVELTGPAVAAQVAAAQRDGGVVSATTEAVTWERAGMTEDPVALDATLDALVAIARALQGRTQAGPFR